MAAYVPNCNHDVFVSYAHVNNKPLGEKKEGWVTTFVAQLRNLLGMHLGRSDNFSICMDDSDLRGNHSVTPEIIGNLGNSANLLVVMSQGYLASDWCQQELNTFVEREGPNSSRIFLVNTCDIKPPQALQDLRGYHFWYRDQDQKERQYVVRYPHMTETEKSNYSLLVEDVAKDLADQLKALRKRAMGHPPAPSSEKDRQKTVFLAEVPYSLRHIREQVARGLDQNGIAILPSKKYSRTDYDLTLKDDIQKSCLFLQLLNEDEGFEMPYLQYKRALSGNAPVIQWRDPSCNLSGDLSAQHRALIESPSVQATTLVEFQAYVLRQLAPKEAVPDRESIREDVIVFLDAAPEDMKLAHMLKEMFLEQGFAYSLPIEVTSQAQTKEVRKDLENNLLMCDAVVVLYDDTRAIWVREQLLYCNKMIGKRDRPLKVLAVYTPPKDQPKEPLNIDLPRQKLQIIKKPSSEFMRELSRLLGRHAA